jgi:histidinol-phosphatase (PHP family)
MKITDTHVHSNWSSDSTLSMINAIEEAPKKNVNCLAFTDHVDIAYPSSSNAILAIPLYLHKITLLQKKSSVQVLKGIEVGITQKNVDETQYLLDRFAFNYIIASCHANDYVAFCEKNAYTTYKDRLLDVYFEQIFFIVSSLRSYHTLAHIDYITRYHSISNEEFLLHENHLDQIFHVLIQRNKALEINTKGLISDQNENLLLSLVKRFHQLGGKWVTFGSDAHHANNIGKHYEKAKKILLQAGFSSFAFPTKEDEWTYCQE